MNINDLTAFVAAFRQEHADASKQEIAKATACHFGLSSHRSIFARTEMAMRFSSAAGPSFSNTVCSLSALRPFDDRPFVVVVVRPSTTDYYLANTTFLKKISHSSQRFRLDHVRGSFNGSDILREYGGLSNTPANFDRLFAMHQEFSWDENVARLAEATGLIRGAGQRFTPTAAQLQAIMASPTLAAGLTGRPDYVAIRRSLNKMVSANREAILRHASIDNVNLRGNLIEQEITGGVNEHGLGDLMRTLKDGILLHIEIKTKLLDRASAPKAYNVDKALEALSDGRTAIAFCFVGVDPAASTVCASVVSIFDSTVLDATRVQFHWAGRNSRGVTQLTGDLTPLFRPGYRERVDVERAEGFLRRLLSD